MFHEQQKLIDKYIKFNIFILNSHLWYWNKVLDVTFSGNK
jgi:hypothetical protein